MAKTNLKGGCKCTASPGGTANDNGRRYIILLQEGKSFRTKPKSSSLACKLYQRNVFIYQYVFWMMCNTSMCFNTWWKHIENYKIICIFIFYHLHINCNYHYLACIRICARQLEDTHIFYLLFYRNLRLMGVLCFHSIHTSFEVLHIYLNSNRWSNGKLQKQYHTFTHTHTCVKEFGMWKNW